MEQLGLSQSTVAGILKRLEAKRLIRRRPDAYDSRRVIIEPTQEGLSLEKQLYTTAMQTENILLDRMSEAEQSEFKRLLEVALDNISKVSTDGTELKKLTPTRSNQQTCAPDERSKL